MKYIVNSETFGTIVYEEGFWSGKKNICINGSKLKKIDKNHYSYDTENDGYTAVEVRSNFISGVTLVIQNQVIQVVPALKWYEWAFLLVAFVFMLVWGNAPALVEIIPIVGGAVGGAVTCCMLCLSVVFGRSTQNIALRFLIYIGVFVLNFFICYLLALLILSVLV